MFEVNFDNFLLNSEKHEKVAMFNKLSNKNKKSKLNLLTIKLKIKKTDEKYKILKRIKK